MDKGTQEALRLAGGAFLVIVAVCAALCVGAILGVSTSHLLYWMFVR